MNLSWKKLLDISTEHQFGSYQKSFFKISPSPETINLLKNNSLLFREGKDSFTLLYAADPDSGEAQKPLNIPYKFRFYIELSFSNFHGITDIPFQTGKVFLFSNISSAKDGDELPLHSGSPSEKYTGADDCYEYSGQTLIINDEEVSSVKYELIDENDIAVFSKTLDPYKGIISHEYDFSHRPAGLYELRKDGVKVKSFYADNFLIKNKTFAVIEIHTGEGVPGDYKFVDSNGLVTSRSYKLKFKSRSTTWRYFVVTRYTELDEDDTLVVEGNSDITFSTGVSKTLPDGNSAFVFESAAEFPLSIESQKNIVLKKEDGVSKTLINQLPTPGASNIMIEEEKVYSDIFVYI